MASRQQLIGSIAGAASQLHQFPQPTSRVTTSFVLSLFGLWLTLGPEHEKIVFPMSSPCWVSAPFLKRAKRLSSPNGSGPLGRRMRSFAASAVPAILLHRALRSGQRTRQKRPRLRGRRAPHTRSWPFRAFPKETPCILLLLSSLDPPGFSGHTEMRIQPHLLTAGNEHKKAG
jgi:hypothetical protein